ncbi:hypothetical protein MFUM_880002 [Methylacidiphilum fumariolicum SolV]|uniref:Uncharacterized protein n=2 Tax=Candidatus Methylacidiphilum fumarolicum TaxID=591154 RepID=I0K0G6_METFB|nr:conserved protein of unknown function [Candidatus Methylacidiphilum fumarolicum]CCG92985.1 hypothetical protein MFUM_880002 [Methylacidiphilum fumariolicum SolV]
MVEASYTDYIAIGARLDITENVPQMAIIYGDVILLCRARESDPGSMILSLRRCRLWRAYGQP